LIVRLWSRLCISAGIIGNSCELVLAEHLSSGSRKVIEVFSINISQRKEKNVSLEIITFVKPAWIKLLWKRLSRITDERKEELNRLRDKFVDPELLKEVYIEPHLQDRNTADELRDERQTAARQPAFEWINEFFQKRKMPLEKDGSHQMFILSDAGMGKTSLLLMIKLMHLTKFWPPEYDCELFKLGDDTMDRVRILPNKGKTVLLLDALDEDRQAWKRIRERLKELLLVTEDFRRVIISSRTQFFPAMEPDTFGRGEIKIFSGHHCPVLFLSPFNDTQVQEFIHRKFPLRWHHHLRLQAGRIRKRRKKADYLLDQMQDLRMRPMLLQHIETLLDVDDRQDWNAYTVYEALIYQWLDRELLKLNKMREQNRNLGRLPKRRELFHACLLIAEQMHRQGGRIITEKDLQRLIREDENIRWLEKFELGGRSLLNRNSDRAFRFSHYTIQEFLLAYGVVNKRLVGQEPLRATDQLARFVDLADGISHHAVQLDLGDIDPQGYVERYKSSWPIQEQLKNCGRGPEMMLLPGGRFRMGDIQGKGDKDERPVHEVEVDSFAIGRYPVTFAEYDVFCEATDRGKPEDEGWGRGDRPVINVDWQDATEYCDWLRRETGQAYRLPTEAEWESACRAGSASTWSFGDDEEQLEDYAWYDKNADDQTHLVGEKKANVWGLHDMHGNVWEWCKDWFDNEYYAKCHKRSIVKNPQGPDRGAHRVLRGGSCFSRPLHCRAVYRYLNLPENRFDNIGFRLVLPFQSAGS
jgi:formylglycine-generating enzyme required for sulfatase activity